MYQSRVYREEREELCVRVCIVFAREEFKSLENLHSPVEVLMGSGFFRGRGLCRTDRFMNYQLLFMFYIRTYFLLKI